MPNGTFPTAGGTNATGGGARWIAPDFNAADLRAFAIDHDIDDDVYDEDEHLFSGHDNIKEILKKRHLSGEERRMAHKPAPDWIETPVGEVCRSADTLMVHDILKKHGLVTG